MDPLEPIANPCVGNCCLDDHEVCLGCFRALAEITGWHAAGRSERINILTAAQQRRNQHQQRFAAAGQQLAE